MKHFKLSIFNIQELDEVTQFRLMNAFLVSICIGIMAPALISLQGTLMLPWLIAIFSILHQLTAKTNGYFTTFKTETLYKMTVIINIFLLLVTFVYFWNPLVMIYLESILGISAWAIIVAYRIKLNNYIAKKHSESMGKFQILQNNILADGSLTRPGGVTLVMIPFHIFGAVILYVIIQSIFVGFLLSNWNFYNDLDV